MEMENINTFIKPSKIHGLGLFAATDIKAGDQIVQAEKYNLSEYVDEWIEYAKKNKKKSMAYTRGYCMINHADTPNTYRGDNFEIIASRDIEKGEEITEDYHLLPDNENPFINNLEEFLFSRSRII